MRTAWFGTVAAGASLLLLSACGGAEKETGSDFQQRLEGAPAWVKKGCSAYSGEKGEYICGVGSMGGTKNLSLCRSTAKNRGRTAIARNLRTKVESLVKDYQRTVTGGGNFGKKSDDQQLVQETTKQITDVSLSGTRAQDTWMANDGTCFALMVLDPARFKKVLQQSNQLDEQVKQHVVDNADKAFEDLDEEMDESDDDEDGQKQAQSSDG